MDKHIIKWVVFQACVIAVLLLLMLALDGCGFNGEQKLTTSDSTQHIVNSGTSTFAIQFSFISEMRQLCEDSLAETAYASEVARTAAIADCTFEKLAILNFNPRQSLCTGDRSGLTPEQLAQIEALCGA